MASGTQPLRGSSASEARKGNPPSRGSASAGSASGRAAANPPIIVMAGGSDRAALRQPEAIVIDIVGQQVRSGSFAFCLGQGNELTISFRIARRIILNVGRRIPHEDFYWEIWGSDPSGGPINPSGVLAQHVYRIKPMLECIGLLGRSRGGHYEFAWRPLGALH